MSTVKLHYKNIAATASTYIGEPGSIFFDPTTSQLRVGDGATPGGNAVTLDIGLATEADITAIKGPSFNSATDSLHNIRAAISTANNTINGVELIVSSMNVTLGAIQGTGFTAGVTDLVAIANNTTGLAQATNLATAQSGITSINNTLASNLSVPTSSLAQASNLATLQSTANNINANTNTITGTGFIPGTDDLHAIRQAITAMQADITAIKTKVGA
jgi:hypothetical protein